MYAIGVMLYQGLTGRLPFMGDAAAVLAQKQREDAALPADSADSLPADLSALCLALLARDPQARPEPAEVLARLG
jgi:serine/threonine-protein kinase